MIRFIYRKRVIENSGSKKIVIYYNVFDIFVSIVLLSLVVFYINNYLSSTFPDTNNTLYIDQAFPSEPIDTYSNITD